ncbi:hypothetical protein GP486_001871 [Trichoglossum hirsutum]|uniref:Uncharacterized protein n=1 Tax=Trichoglossum hirsutum TaxID=265104 RepID=A0A9P8LG73_9PEZI|nr:hypothetical protein GP486_001871 [Trichoglossum hirsutum]
MSTVESSTILYKNEQELRAQIAGKDMSEDLEIEICPAHLGLEIEELFSKFLNDMLSSPASLNAERWIIFFCCFCALSITKSVLIDTCALQDGYKGPLPNEGVEANQMSSAYKALIGLFSWASPCDYLLEDWSKERKDPPSSKLELQDLYRQIQEMVHLDKWKARGIKSSKDFLLSLGSGVSEDGLYNGFYFQMHGLDEDTKSRVLSLNSDAPGTQESSASMPQLKQIPLR